jgi:type IV pilus assembly protein PilA
MFSKIQKRMKSQKGFTLIELLVVIIIIAILAAIAITTFLGQRQKAQDAAAKSLVRNAMMAVESAYTDTRDFSAVTAAMLLDIEPSIVFTAGVDAATAPTALTADNEVNYEVGGALTADEYAVGTVSRSDKTFGVGVNKSADTGLTFQPGNTFYIDGAAATW